MSIAHSEEVDQLLRLRNLAGDGNDEAMLATQEKLQVDLVQRLTQGIDPNAPEIALYHRLQELRRLAAQRNRREQHGTLSRSYALLFAEDRQRVVVATRGRYRRLFPDARTPFLCIDRDAEQRDIGRSPAETLNITPASRQLVRIGTNDEIRFESVEFWAITSDERDRLEHRPSVALQLWGSQDGLYAVPCAARSSLLVYAFGRQERWNLFVSYLAHHMWLPPLFPIQQTTCNAFYWYQLTHEEESRLEAERQWDEKRRREAERELRTGSLQRPLQETLALLDADSYAFRPGQEVMAELPCASTRAVLPVGSAYPVNNLLLRGLTSPHPTSPPAPLRFGEGRSRNIGEDDVYTAYDATAD